MTAVRENGNALKHASESLRKDADVVLTAMGSDGAALEYAHNDLLAHSGVMVVRACVRACGREREEETESTSESWGEFCLRRVCPRSVGTSLTLIFDLPLLLLKFLLHRLPLAKTGDSWSLQPMR